MAKVRVEVYVDGNKSVELFGSSVSVNFSSSETVVSVSDNGIAVPTREVCLPDCREIEVCGRRISVVGFKQPYENDKGFLVRMYTVERFTSREIASVCGCSQACVLDRLHAFHIPVRGRGATKEKADV